MTPWRLWDAMTTFGKLVTFAVLVLLLAAGLRWWHVETCCAAPRPERVDWLGPLDEWAEER